MLEAEYCDLKGNNNNNEQFSNMKRDNKLKLKKF